MWAIAGAGIEPVSMVVITKGVSGIEGIRNINLTEGNEVNKAISDLGLIIGDLIKTFVGSRGGMESPAEEETVINVDDIQNGEYTEEAKEAAEKVQEAAKNYGLEVVASRYSVSVYCPKDSELITKLMKVYQEETGDMGEAISIGGGTYARAIGNAVAYGPNFLHRPDICHQPDEHIYLEDFIKWIAIYAKAIYLLAK